MADCFGFSEPKAHIFIVYPNVGDFDNRPMEIVEPEDRP